LLDLLAFKFAEDRPICFFNDQIRVITLVDFHQLLLSRQDALKPRFQLLRSLKHRKEAYKVFVRLIFLHLLDLRFASLI